MSRRSRGVASASDQQCWPSWEVSGTMARVLFVLDQMSGLCVELKYLVRVRICNVQGVVRQFMLRCL